MLLTCSLGLLYYNNYSIVNQMNKYSTVECVYIYIYISWLASVRPVKVDWNESFLCWTAIQLITALFLQLALKLQNV
jgi:hypothetical protein